MTNSALARSLCDQGFGYNLTRGCTLKGQEKGFHGVLNVGVQSAVLGLVNQRTLATRTTQKAFIMMFSGIVDERASLKGQISSR